MEQGTYRLLAIDLVNAAVISINHEGEITAEWSLPDHYLPQDIYRLTAGSAAYILANSDDNSHLFILDLEPGLTKLPFALPLIEQFALGIDDDQAYAVTADKALLRLDLATGKFDLLGQSDQRHKCLGINVDATAIYTIWQNENQGVLAIFKHNGELLQERQLPGLPTSISASEHYIYICFTATAAGGAEGLIVTTKQLTAPANVVILHHCQGAAGLRTYPCHAVSNPEETLVYVAHEDSGHISILDLNKLEVSDCITVGRSLSYLAMLPNTALAIAGSNMFADLCLVDLVNRRLVSITECDRELFYKPLVLA